MNLKMSVWMSKPVQAMLAEIKCMYERIDLCRLRQRNEHIFVDEIAYVSYVRGKKCPCGWVGLYKAAIEERKRLCKQVSSCALLQWDKNAMKTIWSNWATAETRKCMFGRTSLREMRQKYMSSCTGVKISILHLRIPLLGQTLQRHLESSTQNQR